MHRKRGIDWPTYSISILWCRHEVARETVDQHQLIEDVSSTPTRSCSDTIALLWAFLAAFLRKSPFLPSWLDGVRKYGAGSFFFPSQKCYFSEENEKRSLYAIKAKEQISFHTFRAFHSKGQFLKGVNESVQWFFSFEFFSIFSQLGLPWLAAIFGLGEPHKLLSYGENWQTRSAFFIASSVMILRRREIWS